MTSEQAKEILLLYRPGTADAQDPAISDALAFARTDAELQKWLNERAALYTALSRKFRQISVPAGLKEQILAERPAHIVHLPWWRRPVALAAAAALMVLAGLAAFWLQPRPETDFATYRSVMVSTALRTYGMDLETSDLTQIRAFLAQRSAHADYVLPPRLAQTSGTGCVVLRWQDRPVSMICFASGRPLGPGEKSDLFLFIADQADLPNAPASPSPTIEKVNRLATATWTRNGKIYILAAQGDEAFLRQYL